MTVGEQGPPAPPPGGRAGWTRYRRFTERLAQTEMTASVVLLVALYAVLIAQVFSRYVMNSPLIWTEEIARFLFVWVVFIGAAAVAAKNGHIAVTFLADRLRPSLARWVVRFAATTTTAAAAVVAWASIGFVEATTQLLSPGVQIPMSWVYTAPALGFLLIALHSIEFVITGEDPSREEPIKEEIV